MASFTHQHSQKLVGSFIRDAHFDLAGVLGLVWCRVGVRGRAVPFLAWLLWWRAVSRLALVVVSCAVLAWRVVSCLACVVASRTVLTWRAGEGGGLILPALAKSAPTLPSPPRHPGTVRCAACRDGDRNAAVLWLLVASFAAFFFCRATPYSGAGAHGFARARGEPSDNLCSQCAEDGSPLERAQSEATSARHYPPIAATSSSMCLNTRATGRPWKARPWPAGQ